jgi:hypothetical protein
VIRKSGKPQEFTHQEIIDMIRKDVVESSLREHARRLKVSASFLGEILRGTRNPGRKILDSYGIVRNVEKTVTITYYRRAS